MDGLMDTKTRVDKQTYRKADRVNPWTIIIPTDSGPALVLIVQSKKVSIV